MRAKNIIFILTPCIVVACEDITSAGSTDPITRDLREYARIVRVNSSRYKAGQIFWDKHHQHLLSDDQRAQVEAKAAQIAADNTTDNVIEKSLA